MRGWDRMTRTGREEVTRASRVPEGDLSRASLTSCCLKHDTRAPLLPSTWIAYLMYTLLHTHTHEHIQMQNANSILFFTAHSAVSLPAIYELHQEKVCWPSIVLTVHYSQNPNSPQHVPLDRRKSTFVPTAWKQSCCSENTHSPWSS